MVGFTGGTLMIEYEHVSYTANGQEILREVTLKAEPGECVLLVGPNGSGKSTLLKLGLGLLKPTSGTVRVCGGNPYSSKETRRKIGFIMDSDVLDVLLTGKENLEFFYELYNGSRPDPGFINSVLERVGLSEEAGKKAGQYSKGMRKRLEIGRLLLYHPKAVLLDEPFSGLDSGGKELLVDVVRELKNNGAAVVMVSHETEFALGLADRVVLMVGGRTLAHFSPEEFSNAYVVSGEGTENLDGIKLGPKSVIIVSRAGVDEIVSACREKGVALEEVMPLMKAIRREG